MSEARVSQNPVPIVHTLSYTPSGARHQVPVRPMLNKDGGIGVRRREFHRTCCGGSGGQRETEHVFRR